MSTCREEPCSLCVDIVSKRIVARSKHLSCSSSKGHIFSGKASILDGTCKQGVVVVYGLMYKCIVLCMYKCVI